jgi:hypothetical protein
MRSTARLVGLRALGFLMLLLVAVCAWLMARAAHAEETRPPQVPRIDVSPRGTGQNRRLAPAGTTFGRTTPQTNATSTVHNPPHSPTPPNYSFGARGGSWAPAGAPISSPF